MSSVRKYFVYILFGVLAVYAFCILSDTHPITTREGAALAPLYLMLKGQSPYDLSHLPAYYYSYFFIQQYISLPIAGLFGLNLIVLRILGHLFILGACFLFFKAAIKISGNKSLSFLVTLIFYAGSLYLNTPEVRGDSYGLFFYIAAISAYILFDNKFLRTSVLVLASLLGFFTKYYFIASWLMAFAYELLIFSRKRLGIFLFISLLLSTIAVLLVSIFQQGYYTVFLRPFLVTGAMYEKDLFFAFKQFAVFVVLLSPLIIAFIFIYGKKIINKIPIKILFSRNKFDEFGINIRLESYLLWGCIASTGGTVLFLATNIGNQMTYLMHLMLAWYLWYALFLFKKFNVTVASFYNSAIICLLFFVVFLRPWNYFTKSRGNWQKAYSYIDKHQNIFGSSVFAAYIITSNKQLYNSGHTEFFPALKKYSVYLKDDSNLIGHINADVMEASNLYYEMMKSNILNKKFDLILLDNAGGIGNLFAREIGDNYIKKDSCNIYLPHSRHLIEVQILEPKSN